MTRLLWIFAALGLTGCGNLNNPIQSADIYKMELDSRGLTGFPQAKEQAQRRAAELTLSKGYTHYVIQEERHLGADPANQPPPPEPAYASQTSPLAPDSALPGVAAPGSFPAPEGIGQPVGNPAFAAQPQSSLVIIMYRGPVVPANALDAKFIVSVTKRQ